jgi:hypothetical protein
VLRDGETGAAQVGVALDEAARTLTYRRRVDRKQRLLATQQLYETVRGLFGQMERSDAQPIVLVRG